MVMIPGVDGINGRDTYGQPFFPLIRRIVTVSDKSNKSFCSFLAGLFRSLFFYFIGRLVFKRSVHDSDRLVKK